MSANINIARSDIWPHLTEAFNREQQTIKCECSECGAYKYLQWVHDPMELDSIAARISFANRHKHEEWPEFLTETPQ